MFSLIITLISIALVVALAIATLYYGGEAWTNRQAQAQAAKLLGQSQQILAAGNMFYADNGRWPATIAEMVPDYLVDVPAAALDKTRIPEAAYALGTQWQVVVNGRSAFSLRAAATGRACQFYNQQAYGQDGVKEAADASLPMQCFGTTENYHVLIQAGSEFTTPLTDADLQAALSDGTAVFLPGGGNWKIEPTVIGQGGHGGGLPLTSYYAGGNYDAYFSTERCMTPEVTADTAGNLLYPLQVNITGTGINWLQFSSTYTNILMFGVAVPQPEFGADAEFGASGNLHGHLWGVLNGSVSPGAVGTTQIRNVHVLDKTIPCVFRTVAGDGSSSNLTQDVAVLPAYVGEGDTQITLKAATGDSFVAGPNGEPPFVTFRVGGSVIEGEGITLVDSTTLRVWVPHRTLAIPGFSYNGLAQVTVVNFGDAWGATGEFNYRAD